MALYRGESVSTPFSSCTTSKYHHDYANDFRFGSAEWIEHAHACKFTMFASACTHALAPHHSPCSMFMLLKLASFFLAALQLRSGFPPRASVHGGGRQRFFFFSRADVWHQMGYYIYMVSVFIPGAGGFHFVGAV